ncbi:cupin domain-containing protein [Botrimarina sp.]|uniref:cupin domain-containing protein n=1 Tax=Botrimarina sp. TaxID=2795802 RepID=UPI0032EF5278
MNDTARYRLTRLADLPPAACPCGTARRAFVDEPEQTASMHVVEITADSRTHYHRRLTEMYYVLEGEGRIELDGDTFPLAPGVAVMIKPGCRHRAYPADRSRPLRVLNVPVPAFDPADEHFD